MTNSERRISHVRRAVPPGEARADWAITCDFARRLERHLRPGAPSLFAFESAEALFEEYAAHRRPRSGLQRPELRTDRHPRSAAMAVSAAANWAPRGCMATVCSPLPLVVRASLPSTTSAEGKREARYPLTLNTGRLRDQWHGMSRTGTAARLFGHVEEALLCMNAEDMRRRRLLDGQLVKMKSRRGSPIPAGAEG